jgi:hypothetical protein
MAAAERAFVGSTDALGGADPNPTILAGGGRAVQWGQPLKASGQSLGWFLTPGCQSDTGDSLKKPNPRKPMTTLTAKIASAFAVRAQSSPPFQSENASPAPIAPAKRTPQTRRSFLMNTMVALPIVAALPVVAPAMDFPVAPVTAPTPADIELVELADQLIAAAEKSRQLNRIVDEMDCLGYKIQPPAGMEIRSGDADLGIPLPDQADNVHLCGFYSTADVNSMRKPKWMDCEIQGREDDDSYVATFRYITPSAETRARVDEIVAAYDEWSTRKEKKPRGFRAAKRAYDKAEWIETALEQKIHTIRAHTIEGMIAKARCAELYYFETGFSGSFSDSIAKDLLALNARASTATPMDIKPEAPASTAAIEAIQRYRKASKGFDRASLKLTEARDAAKEEHGREPYALIHWRNFYIGGSELKRTRETFLVRGEDPATIEEEYRDAKKRYRAQVKAVKDWEKQVGVDGLCQSLEQARAELYDAREALGTVRLESTADAAALLNLLRANLKQFGEFDHWETAAFNNASKFLVAALA